MIRLGLYRTFERGISPHIPLGQVEGVYSLLRPVGSMTTAGLSSYNNQIGKNSLNMDLKETIISSSFFHVILFLLMVALSSYTTGSSGKIRNIISIDLAEEKDLPDTAIGPAEEAPLAASPPSMEEASLPDEAVNTSSGESMPESEKKSETTAGPAKIEKAEKPPAETEGAPSLEAYYQFIMLHKKIFGQKAGARVNELLGEAFKVNTREFYGGKAIVSLKFGPDRKLSGVLVDSASPELKAFFEEILWDTVPAPAAYSLGLTGVQIEFTVLEGSMRFKIDAL
jgi:hypothetical protein